MWTHHSPTYAKKNHFSLEWQKNLLKFTAQKITNWRSPQSIERCKDIIGIITEVNLFPYLGFDVIITFLSKIASNDKIITSYIVIFYLMLTLFPLWKHEQHIHWKTWHVHKLQIPLSHLSLLMQIGLQESHVHPCSYLQLGWRKRETSVSVKRPTWMKCLFVSPLDLCPLDKEIDVRIKLSKYLLLSESSRHVKEQVS